MPTDQVAVKDAAHVIASVRIPDLRLNKLIRMAAIERDVTRSEFMAEAAVRVAREVLRLQREEDFRDWLDAA
jgi:uncharacterized protein (DUF1778 family)